MEMNDQSYNTLQEYLKKTLNPATEREATYILTQTETNQGFPILLLNLIASEVVDQNIRLAAAIYFKNYVKRNWVKDNEEAADKIHSTDREEIKRQLVQLMITVPDKIQLQISDALSFIAGIDFPERWEGLLPELISKLSATDYKTNNGILSTAHSIFRRWKSEFRSDELFSKIKYVLEMFCEPYKQLFEFTDRLIDENQNNRGALQILTNSLILLIKIHYDLNCQDIPEFFEDNLGTFMRLFDKYLIYQNPLLVEDDEEEEGPLEQIRVGICHILQLYASSYEDVFPQLEQFVRRVIDLLALTGQEPKYDTFACSAFSFLTASTKIERVVSIFADETLLRNMCEKIALPNICIRNVDVELFEDNPIEYIRRDLEGSDTDTRRRASSDFIRGLMERFTPQVTMIMTAQVQAYLTKYNNNPQKTEIDRDTAMKDKDTAIFLLVAIAARASISRQGVTKTNADVDVVDFFTRNVLGDLQSEVHAGHPIVKVDAIKYVYTFRNQLTKEQLLAVFPLLVKQLESSNYVVYTYATIAIERILFIRHGKVMMFTSDDIKPFAETLLNQLFRLIELGQTPEKLSENDYLMKAVMRVIITCRQDMVPYVNIIMSKLTNILAIVSKNPSNPKFNHDTFESIGALIRFICPISDDSLTYFEKVCFGPFETILSEGIQEFTPYVFQLLAQLLEQHKGQGLTLQYTALMAVLLNPNIWEQGNIPALVRLLQAYMNKGINNILEANQLEPILAIFQQKLVCSRQFDHYGMLLLDTITARVPIATLGRYLPSLLSSILKRLQSKKKKDSATPVFDRFTRNFTLWMCLCFTLDNMGGPDTIIKVYESLQPNLFQQIVSMFVLPDLEKLSLTLDRKLGAVGIIRLLTKSEFMFQLPDAVPLWPALFAKLMELLSRSVVLFKDDDSAPDELYALDSEEGGYQTTFAKLATSNPTPEDHTAHLTPPKELLAQSLAGLPNEKKSIIKKWAQSEHGQPLQAYFQQESALSQQF